MTRNIRQEEDQIDIGGPLLHYKQKGNKVFIKDKNDSVYVLSLSFENGASRQICISKKTYLITKTVQTIFMMGRNIEISKYFEDYRKAENGYVYPGTETDWYDDEFSIVTENRSIQVNPNVNLKIFSNTEF